MIIEVKSSDDMIALGAELGRGLKGGEIIELIGDVGAGKTTLTKGIAQGLEIDEAIQSPTFTINRVYSARDGLTLVHYDFYRLNDAGVMAAELDEVLRDERSVTIIEWAEVVAGVLPDARTRITIVPNAIESRLVTIDTQDERLKRACEDWSQRV